MLKFFVADQCTKRHNKNFQLTCLDVFGEKKFHALTTVRLPKDGHPNANLTKDHGDVGLHRFKKLGSKNCQNIYPPSATLHLYRKTLIRHGWRVFPPEVVTVNRRAEGENQGPKLARPDEDVLARRPAISEEPEEQAQEETRGRHAGTGHQTEHTNGDYKKI